MSTTTNDPQAVPVDPVITADHQPTSCSSSSSSSSSPEPSNSPSPDPEEQSQEPATVVSSLQAIQELLESRSITFEFNSYERIYDGEIPEEHVYDVLVGAVNILELNGGGGLPQGTEEEPSMSLKWRSKPGSPPSLFVLTKAFKPNGPVYSFRCVVKNDELAGTTDSDSYGYRRKLARLEKKSEKLQGLTKEECARLLHQHRTSEAYLSQSSAIRENPPPNIHKYSTRACSYMKTLANKLKRDGNPAYRDAINEIENTYTTIKELGL